MDAPFDIDEALDFIEGLCERHTEINHNVDDKKCFARGEEHVEIIRKHAGKVLVAAVSIEGLRIGEKDDKQMRWELVIRTAVYAEKGISADSAKQQARKKANEIMFDLWNEMELQQEQELDEETCGIMRWLEPEAMSFQEVEDAPWLINHYGWDLTIPFKVYMPPRNAAKWRA